METLQSTTGFSLPFLVDKQEEEEEMDESRELSSQAWYNPPERSRSQGINPAV